MRVALLAGVLVLLSVFSVSAVAPQATGTGIDGGFEDELSGGPTAQTDAPINRIAHQTLVGPSRGDLEHQSVNVGAAIGIGGSAATDRLEHYALAERFEGSSDEGAVLEEGLKALEAEVRAERDSARSTRRSYVNRSIDATTVARELARRQAAHERHEERLAWFRTVLEAREAPVLEQRLDRLDRELLGHTDPVQTRLLSSLRGVEDPVHFFLEASENGTILATIDDGRYVRSAFREDLRRFGVAQMGLPTAASRAEELYPLVFGGDLGSNTAIRGRTGQSFFIESTLPFGSIQSYLDGNTRTIFAEVQRRTLSEMNQPEVVSTSENDTQVLVNRTYSGGPLRIATVDNDTGRPVESTIAVGDRQLRTGDDGVVWTLAPPGPTMRVEATREPGTASMIVRTLPITPLNNSA